MNVSIYIKKSNQHEIPQSIMKGGFQFKILDCAILLFPCRLDREH